MQGSLRDRTAQTEKLYKKFYDSLHASTVYEARKLEAQVFRTEGLMFFYLLANESQAILEAELGRSEGSNSSELDLGNLPVDRLGEEGVFYLAGKAWIHPDKSSEIIEYLKEHKLDDEIYISEANEAQLLVNSHQQARKQHPSQQQSPRTGSDPSPPAPNAVQTVTAEVPKEVASNSPDLKSLTFGQLVQNIEQLETRINEMIELRGDTKAVRGDCKTLISDILVLIPGAKPLLAPMGEISTESTAHENIEELSREKIKLINLRSAAKEIEQHLEALCNLYLDKTKENNTLQGSQFQKPESVADLQRDLVKSGDELANKTKKIERYLRSHNELIHHFSAIPPGDDSELDVVINYCSKFFRSDRYSGHVADLILGRLKTNALTTDPPEQIQGFNEAIWGGLLQACLDADSAHKVLGQLSVAKIRHCSADDAYWLRFLSYWSEDTFRKYYKMLPKAALANLAKIILATGVRDNRQELSYLAVEVARDSSDSQLSSAADSLIKKLQQTTLEEILSHGTKQSDQASREDAKNALNEIRDRLSWKPYMRKDYQGIMKEVETQCVPLVVALDNSNRSDVVSFIRQKPEDILETALRNTTKTIQKNHRSQQWVLQKKLGPIWKLSKQWLRATNKVRKSDRSLKSLWDQIRQVKDLGTALLKPDAFIDTNGIDLTWFLHDEKPGRAPRNYRLLHLSQVTKDDPKSHYLHLATDLIRETLQPIQDRNAS